MKIPAGGALTIRTPPRCSLTPSTSGAPSQAQGTTVNDFDTDNPSFKPISAGGFGMTDSWRRIVDEPDALAQISGDSSCNRASLRWG